MFLTTERDAGDAKRFWESVASGVGFQREDDPRNRLRSELLRMSIPSSLSAHGSSKRHVSSEYMLRVCEASPRPQVI